MKTIKIYFSIFAFVLAIGGVYASKIVVSATGYYYISDGETTPTNPPSSGYRECFALETCADTGDFICKTTIAQTININGTSTLIPVGTPLFKVDGTVCTAQLKRVTL